MGGARLSARRAVRIRPVEALGEAELPAARMPRGSMVAGLLCVAGGVALTLLLSALSTEAASTRSRCSPRWCGRSPSLLAR